jgi:hypothetical protein
MDEMMLEILREQKNKDQNEDKASFFFFKLIER